MIKRACTIVWILISFVGLYSCQNMNEFHEMRSTDGEWSSVAERFEYTPNDTLSPMDVFIHLRAGDEYPFSNIYLISKLTTPGGKVLVDTLEYEMANPDGQLLGDGFTGVKESKLLYKKGYVFDKKGVYTFDIRHAIRAVKKENEMTSLEGIYSVGLSIEEEKNN